MYSLLQQKEKENIIFKIIFVFREVHLYSSQASLLSVLIGSISAIASAGVTSPSRE